MESLKHQQQLTEKSSKNSTPISQTPESQGFHLPIEITSNILSRLPVPAVLRFRSVCKGWSHLTRTDAFIRQHLINFHNDETDQCFIYVSGEFYEYTVEYKSQGHSRSLKIDKKTERQYSKSNYCNGLLCIYDYDDSNLTISIVNPAVDDKLIELTDVGMTKNRVLDVHLCHQHCSDKYKLIRFFKFDDDTGVEILTLGDDSWRQVGKIPSNRVGDEPVLVHRAVHWMTRENKILSFKIADENFDLIECPAKDTSEDDKEASWLLRNYDDLTEYQGCLCIVRRHWHPWKLKFFVMEDYANRIWIEHIIDLMQMDETPFSHKDGFERCPKYRSHNGKLVLVDNGGFWRCLPEKYYYFNLKTKSFENCDGTPQARLQYKESLISTRKICYGEN